MLKGLLSFRFRIGAAIFLVATAAVVLGLTTYYHRVSEQVRGQMANRVRDFGKIGVSLFTPDDIRYLENLDNRLASPHSDTHTENNIGVPLSALSEEEKTSILRTNEFQRIVQKLRRIRRASGDKIVTEETVAAPSESPRDVFPIHRTWIAGVGMHHAVSDYLRVLCADEFQEVDRNKNQRIDAEEKVFHVGDIFNAQGLRGVASALTGQSSVTSGYRSEESGIFIAGYTPIRNARNAIVALLIVDYSAATEFDTLFNLKIVGYYIVIAALIASIFIAAIVSRFLIAPIESMQAAAARIGRRDFAIRLKSQTNDELSELADAINLMAQELGEYSTNMEARIDVRTREISSILTELQQGLLTIDAHGVIEAEYSRAALTIFGVAELAHHKFSAFFTDAMLQESIDKYIALNFSGEAFSAQMLERANPLRKIIYINRLDRKLHLRFSFSPLVGASGVERLLILIVDETDEETLREKIDIAEANKRSEFDVLINMMQVPPALLQDFLTQQRLFLREGKSLIAAFDKFASADFLKFATETHALKGNALQFGFSELAEILHELEQLLQDASKKRPSDERFIRHEISRCINTAEGLILHRDQLIAHIKALVGHDSAEYTSLASLKAFWSRQLEERAQKNSVRVSIVIDFATGTDSVLQQLHNVLVQLVRNTFAHGLETPAERRAAGKDEAMHIGISSRLNAHGFEVYYDEDGRGFEQLKNVKMLPIEAMLQKKLTSAHKTATLEYGRGLGMNYVAHKIKELKGTVTFSSQGALTRIRIFIPRD